MRPNVLLLRMILIGILLSVMAYQLGGLLVKALIPLYQWAFTHLDDRLRILHFEVVKLYGEQFLQLDVLLSDSFFMNDDFYKVNSAVYNNATMPLGYVLQPVIFFLTLALSWPASGIKQYFYRIILGTPLILTLMMLDIPVQFNDMLWDGIQKYLGIASSEVGIYKYWSDFINGGGLIALSLGCGMLVIGWAEKLNCLLAREAEP